MWPFVDAAKIGAAQTASKAKEPSVGMWIFCIALFSGYISLLVFLGAFLKKKSASDDAQRPNHAMERTADRRTLHF